LSIWFKKIHSAEPKLAKMIIQKQNGLSLYLKIDTKKRHFSKGKMPLLLNGKSINII